MPRSGACLRGNQKKLAGTKGAFGSALGKVAILIAIAGLFLVGMAGTVYLSLRSPEVQVPEVTGKNIVDAERILADAGLNVRRRATRYSAEVAADTVLDQTPRAGDQVKGGQTVAVVISRAEAKEGESSMGVRRADDETKNDNKNDNGNQNEPAASATKDNRNANANENANENANRPKRNTNKNKNTNNANGNTSANSNANSNLNANLTTNSRNADNRNAPGRPDAGRNTNARPDTNNPDSGNRNSAVAPPGANTATNRNTAGANANRPRTTNNRNTNTQGNRNARPNANSSPRP